MSKLSMPGTPAPYCQTPLAGHNMDLQATGESIPLHEKFYFPDSASGLSTFKVDGIYYKVHRYMLERESPVFETMFSSPSPSEGQDGESIEKPIIIPDVSRSEFEALLDFLYNGAFNFFEFYSKLISEFEPTVKRNLKLFAEGIKYIRRKISDDNESSAIFDLLSISLRFEFKRITDMVVAIIDLLDRGVRMQDCVWDLHAVKRIDLASRHDALRHWYLPALQSLVGRPAPLTADEGRILGYHRMAIIAAEREKRQASGCNITSIPPGFLPY